MKKAVLAALVAANALVAVPAQAGPQPWAPNDTYRNDYGDIQYRRTDNGIRYWQGEDGRYYCKRKNGTVGLLVGAALGALLGRAIDTHGERATGTILGAVAGAVIGNEIAKGPTRCR